MNKEKEIEEMAKDFCISAGDAAIMYDVYGYRKKSEGEWILHKPRRENRNTTYKCSVCGKLCSSYYNDVGEWKCCPHCESRMRKGESK